MNLNLDKLNYSSDPFPHVLIKNPFDDTDALDDYFPPLEEFSNKSFRMNGDMTYPQENYLKLICKSKIYNSLHNFIYSSLFISNFLEVFKKDIKKLIDNGDLLFNPFEIPKISSPYERNIFEFDR